MVGLWWGRWSLDRAHSLMWAPDHDGSPGIPHIHKVSLLSGINFSQSRKSFNLTSFKNYFLCFSNIIYAMIWCLVYFQGCETDKVWWRHSNGRWAQVSSFHLLSALATLLPGSEWMPCSSPTTLCQLWLQWGSRTYSGVSRVPTAVIICGIWKIISTDSQA